MAWRTVTLPPPYFDFVRGPVVGEFVADFKEYLRWGGASFELAP
jgi:hypothetical protein